MISHLLKQHSISKSKIFFESDMKGTFFSFSFFSLYTFLHLHGVRNKTEQGQVQMLSEMARENALFRGRQSGYMLPCSCAVECSDWLLFIWAATRKKIGQSKGSRAGSVWSIVQFAAEHLELRDLADLTLPNL